MKIIVTSSLGNISKLLVRELIEKEHQVTVINSSLKRQVETEAMGANAAIESLEDEDFLIKSFTNANSVFCMIPPNNYFDQNIRKFIEGFNGANHSATYS